MKLSKSQAEKACKEYGLGKLKEVKPITNGYVNYSFLFKTDKGKFIFQVFGGDFGVWKKDRLALELKVLNHLKGRFPYETPQPIRSVNRSYFKIGRAHV